MARPEKVRLGDLLVEAKLISSQQLESALILQKSSGKRLGRVLVENAYISEEQISEALAQQFHIPFVNIKQYTLNPDLVRLLPEAQARRFRAIVLEAQDQSVLIGMADPTDLAAFDEISHLLKYNIDVVVLTEGQVLEGIDRGYRRTDEFSGQMSGKMFAYSDIATQANPATAEENSALATQEATLSQQLQALFDNALQLRASALHIERNNQDFSHRYRIDGVLHADIPTPYKISEAVVLRLKLMAELDIAEKTAPQLGGFNQRAGEQKIDVRLATCPMENGESLVMRFSYPDHAQLKLAELNMPELLLKRLREILHTGQGMVLLTGAADCGTSTTLQAMLTEIDTLTQKIISIENPPAQSAPGVQQIKVGVAAGLSFAAALRVAQEQDPDILVLNQIPDNEVARIALHTAMNGQMVLACIPAHDAVNALCHLVELGMPRFMAATSLQAVVAQRLLRRVCGHCSEIYVANMQEIAWLESEGIVAQQLGTLHRGRGCSHCHGTGYHGRIAVYEMLEMRRALVDAAAHDTPTHYLQEAHKQMQGKTLLAHALSLVKQGQTTLYEAMRMGNRHTN